MPVIYNNHTFDYNKHVERPYIPYIVTTVEINEQYNDLTYILINKIHFNVIVFDIDYNRYSMQ